MNGWLDEKGTFRPCPTGGHYKYLTEILNFSDEQAQEIPKRWVVIRNWDSAQDAVKKRLGNKKNTSFFSDTERGRYTLAQLEFLQQNNCFIDVQKI